MASYALLCFWAVKIEAPPLSKFTALALFDRYYSGFSANKVTPDTKRVIKKPLNLAIAACIALAVLQDQKQQTPPLDSILQQICDVSPTSDINIEAITSTLHALQEEIAEDCLAAVQSTPTTTTPSASSIQPPLPLPPTALAISTLHTQLITHCSPRVTYPPILLPPDIDLAYRVLEFLCLTDNGAQCHDVLHKGGTLTAAACITASSCVFPTFPPQPPPSPPLLEILSSLSEFPVAVIAHHCHSIIHRLYSPYSSSS